MATGIRGRSGAAPAVGAEKESTGIEMPRGGKRPGAGRPKGSPNKVNGDIRAMISGALHDVGGRDYLAEQARSNPQSFMALVGKTVPKELHAHLIGEFRMLLDGQGVKPADAE